MHTTYKFLIDTSSVAGGEFDDMYDDWDSISVELSDEEFSDLIKARKTWYSELKKSDLVDDDEYFLHKYVPNIHQKIRKALYEQAPSIWGEKIMPKLHNVDIYLPDDIDWNEFNV